MELKCFDSGFDSAKEFNIFGYNPTCASLFLRESKL